MACAAAARSRGASNSSAIDAISRAAAWAAPTSCAASMISTYAGSSRARATRSRVSSTARRIAVAAASTLPWANRRCARPGCGSRPAVAGLAVGLLGLGKLAAQPVEIGLQVEGSADPRSSDGLGEPFTGSLRLAHGVPPGSLQLHELGAVHETLAAIGNEVRLRCAPLGQRRRPLPRPAQIEDLLAVLEHRAVDDPDADRRHLAGRDGDHDLVEQRHALRGLSRSEQRLPEAQPAERHQLRVAEALADPGGLGRRVRGPPRRRPRTGAEARGPRGDTPAPRSRADRRRGAR